MQSPGLTREKRCGWGLPLLRGDSSGEEGQSEEGEEGDGESEEAWREEGDRLRSNAGAGLKHGLSRSWEGDWESKKLKSNVASENVHLCISLHYSLFQGCMLAPRSLHTTAKDSVGTKMIHRWVISCICVMEVRWQPGPFFQFFHPLITIVKKKLDPCLTNHVLLNILSLNVSNKSCLCFRNALSWDL